MRLTTSLLFGALVNILGPLLAGRVEGQTRTLDLSYSTECKRFRFDTVRVATLGRSEDAELLSPFTPVTRSKKGDYFALNDSRSSILVFGADGQFKKAVGRLGDGPGELSRGGISLFVDAFDSVYVVERGRRVSVFTPTIQFARSFTFVGASNGFAVLPGVGFVYGATVATPASIGLPFHIVSPKGTPIASFGSQHAMIVGGQQRPPSPLGPVVGLDGGLYTWWPHTYAIDRYDIHGMATNTTRLTNVPWIVGRSSDRIAADPRIAKFLADPTISAPRPNITVLDVDRFGRIWVNAHIPSKDSRSKGPPPGWSTRQLIEVIDQHGGCVASMPFPYAIHSIPGTDYFFTNAEDSTGIPQVIVWRIRLSDTK
jgi:hypothetical protein